jgi:catechol 2,3-dioxygenase-like lactoylglutathione lyase family enzyme
VRPITIVANLKVPNIEDSKDFYRDFLGLGSEEFKSPDSGACVQLVTRDETSPSDSVVSVMTDDVDAAYAEALSRGFDIVRPLTTESWGVRRFLVRAPDGNVVNIVHHQS